MTITADDFWQLSKLPKDDNKTKILFTEQSQGIEDNLDKIADIFGGKKGHFVDTMVVPACKTLFLMRSFNQINLFSVVNPVNINIY